MLEALTQSLAESNKQDSLSKQEVVVEVLPSYTLPSLWDPEPLSGPESPSVLHQSSAAPVESLGEASANVGDTAEVSSHNISSVDDHIRGGSSDSNDSNSSDNVGRSGSDVGSDVGNDGKDSSVRKNGMRKPSAMRRRLPTSNQQSNGFGAR